MKPRDLSYVSPIERTVMIARQLGDGALGATYVEAYLILAGLLSMLAARRWPGERKDRKRFVELLVRHGGSGFDTKRIRVPLLFGELGRKNDSVNRERLAVHLPEFFGPGNDARIATGDDVDCDEAEVQTVTNLPLAEIRKFSYAAVFYRQVRSGVVHEYTLGRDAGGTPMSSRLAAVSYINTLEIDPEAAWEDPHEGGRRHRRSRRKIHFHPDAVADLVLAIAERLVSDPGPASEPATWWIDGKD